MSRSISPRAPKDHKDNGYLCQVHLMCSFPSCRNPCLPKDGLNKSAIYRFNKEVSGCTRSHQQLVRDLGIEPNKRFAIMTLISGMPFWR